MELVFKERKFSTEIREEFILDGWICPVCENIVHERTSPFCQCGTLLRANKVPAS